MTGALAGDLAVKVLPVSIKGDSKLVNQVFQREYDSLSRLKHTNIVELLDGGRDPATGERYFVFPWCENGLSVALRERPLQGWDDFWTRYGRELTDGLAYAHGQSIAHRDIKPQNVLIDSEGRPCISDFGIAKSLARVAPDQTLRDFATRPFAPREYDDGRHPTERDVFSFAALAVLALGEIDPFAGYEDDPYRAIDDALGVLDVPAGIEAVLKRCLQDDPNARPRDAAKLGELIAVVEDERGVAAASAAARSASKCHVFLTNKVRATLLDALDLQTDIQLEEFLADDLAEESAVLGYDRDSFEGGDETTDHFYVIGTELRIHVVIAEETRDHLVAVNAWPVGSSAMDRERDRGWSPGWRWALGRPTNEAQGAACIETLERAVSARAAEEDLRRKRSARDRQLVIWRRTLAALRSVEQAKESPLRYFDATELPAGIRFRTHGPTPEDLIGQVRVVQGTEGQFLYGEVTDVETNALTLMPSRGDFHSLPDQGELRVDTMASRSALRRQEQGLDALQYDRSLRPELRDLLLEPGTARVPDPASEIEWKADLDEPKRLAVAAALGSEDVLLVEGPPGTGKTTFITELILQHLDRNPKDRVLVSSQTNAALDNVLERLIEADPGLRQTRIARRGDSRIAPGVQELLLDEQTDRWRDEVIASGRRWLHDWASARGIAVGDLEAAMRFEELAKEREALGLLDAEKRDLITREEQGDLEGGDNSNLGEERLREIAEESATAEASAGQASERLIEIGVVKRAAELSDLGAVELRRRAEKLMPAGGEAADECRDLINLLSDWHARFGRGSAFPAATLLRSQVVAATCIGYASVRGSESIEFDLCIIDEASKAMATEMLVPMTRARKWVVVGDHRQLPPFVDDALQTPEILAKHQLRADEVEATLFDRLRERLPPECARSLDRQHRMAPPIGDLISECFYGGALASEPRSPANWLHLLSPKAVTWYTTSRIAQRYETRHGTTILNSCEARSVATLLGRAEFAANATKKTLSVVVLSGYSGQRDLIRREIGPSLSKWKHLEVDCSTIDAFQGREADIAIYSVTRSNKAGNIGFLNEERRLNVALSRGRDALILVGDHVGIRQITAQNPFIDVLDYIDSEPECALEEMQL
jgi:serine/threonine protein kinase